jgi:phosphoribosylanthranilate isomerase
MSPDVKICGLRTPEAVDAAIAGGATHVGFIFFPKSPRHLEPEAAAALRAGVRGRAKAVAVTVDADDALLDRIVAAMDPDMLQLHGSESPERVLAVKARHGLPVIKALSMSVPADLDRLNPYRAAADRFLLDAKPPAGSELPGGNGVAFDWSMLRGLDGDTDYFLSGGLTPANVGEALRQASPTGLDVSSGVESAPGVKDVRLIGAFFEALQRR